MAKVLRFVFLVMLSLGIILAVSACSKPASLSDLVIAKGLNSTTQEPAEKTNVFVPSAETIYASVKLSDGPSNTKVKAVWTAVDVPGVDKDKVIEASTVDTSGTRYIGFSLTKATKRWPAGKYNVQVFLADKAVATADFTVESKAALSEATLASKIDQKTQEPLAKTKVFSPDQEVIFASVKLADAPPKTEVKAIWTVQEVAGHKKGEVIDEYSVETEGTRYLGFSLSNEGDPWPTGKYAVALYLDEKQIGNYDFTVEGSALDLISEVTMAKSVDSRTKEPKEKTSVFSPSTEVIYAAVKLEDAPRNTEVTAVWTVVDVAGVETGYEIDEASLTADGTRYLAFSLARESEKWATGKYVVKIYVNGKLADMANYSIEATGSSSSAKSATLSETTMAKSVDPTTQEPKQKATSFSPTTDVFYCSTKVTDAPAGTEVTAVWTIVDVPGYTKGEEIDENTLVVDGTRYLGFTLTRGTRPWPVGKYAVKLYINDTQAAVVNFSVAE